MAVSRTTGGRWWFAIALFGSYFAVTGDFQYQYAVAG